MQFSENSSVMLLCWRMIAVGTQNGDDFSATKKKTAAFGSVQPLYWKVDHADAKNSEVFFSNAIFENVYQDCKPSRGTYSLKSPSRRSRGLYFHLGCNLITNLNACSLWGQPSATLHGKCKIQYIQYLQIDLLHGTSKSIWCIILACLCLVKIQGCNKCCAWPCVLCFCRHEISTN